MLDRIVKSNLIFGEAEDVDNFPDQPGIYAWFLPLRGYDGGDAGQFLGDLIASMSSAAGLTELDGETGQLSLTVRRRVPSISEGLSTKGITSMEVQSAAKLMLCCSFLTAPIYVGMTVEMGLQARIKSHLANPSELLTDNWAGSFRSRVAKVTGNKSYLNRCLVAMLPMPKEKFTPEFVKFFEHVLIRTIRPELSKRG